MKTSTSRKKKERHGECRRLLEEARKKLGGASEWHIMKENGPRDFPTFQISEIELGPLLGIGGFCDVFEIEGFSVNPMSGDSDNAEIDSADEDIHQSHYHAQDARNTMARHARREGDARYAVKLLSTDLKEPARTQGIVDLALEAKLLSALWHPSIVKMRGYCAGSELRPDFFIVMDRLYDTLDVRTQNWREKEKAAKGNLFGVGADKEAREMLMTDRLVVAYDLAVAFAYMHANRIVYRDVKPENVGFDVRGDVKVFDFGLSRSLPTDSAKRRGFKLTPRTGSLPYMAPEIAEALPYDTACDVFSFSILLWEILSLKPAFKGYSKPEFLERVVRRSERPMLSRKWPALTRTAVKEGWSRDPKDRPEMNRVAKFIRADLNGMTSDLRVKNRTQHMLSRSSRSFAKRTSSADC